MMFKILMLILILIFNTNFDTKNLLPWQTLKHLSNKSKSTPTIALRPRKTFIQDNKCTPQFTSRKNYRTSLVETTKNLIKKSNSEEEAIFNIREIVIEKRRNHEKDIVELTHSIVQVINERLDKISQVNYLNV